MLYMSYADDLDRNCLLNDMPTARLIGTGKIPGPPRRLLLHDQRALRHIHRAGRRVEPGRVCPARIARCPRQCALSAQTPQGDARQRRKVVATAYTLREDILVPARPPEKYLEKMRRGYGQHCFDTSPIEQALAAVPR